MIRKLIQTKELRAIVKNLINVFPSKIEFIEIFFIDGEIQLRFIDHDKNDVSHKFVAKEIDNVSLYSTIADKISKCEKIISIVNFNDVYSFKVKNWENKVVYLDADKFRKVRTDNGYTMMGLADEISIGYNTLQTIENSAPIDHSISHIVKYSLFFKTNIVKFFDKGLGKQLMTIMLAEWVAKGFIQESIMRSILENEFNSKKSLPLIVKQD